MNILKFKPHLKNKGIIQPQHVAEYYEKTTMYSIDEALRDDKYSTFIFDTGWITFKIENDECFIMSLYRDESSKLDRDEMIESFVDMCRDNKVKKITMITDIDPKMWVDNYGFKIIKPMRHKMEKTI